MGFDGMYGHPQPLCNLGIGQTINQEQRDVLLPRRQGCKTLAEEI
jgi:hypothetical protein